MINDLFIRYETYPFETDPPPLIVYIYIIYKT